MDKLKNQQGATLLMALLLLLVTSMVSVVILSSATSAARHLETDRAAQQSYLTVSSAAELLRDDILSASYQQVTTRTTFTYNGYVSETKGDPVFTAGVMADWLQAGMAAVDSGRVFTDEITLSLPATVAMENVRAVFTMGEDYDVTVALSLSGGGDSDCLLTLELSGDYKTETSLVSSNTYSRTEKLTTELRWRSPQIRKGGAE